MVSLLLRFSWLPVSIFGDDGCPCDGGGGVFGQVLERTEE